VRSSPGGFTPFLGVRILHGFVSPYITHSVRRITFFRTVESSFLEFGLGINIGVLNGASQIRNYTLIGGRVREGAQKQVKCYAESKVPSSDIS
jgi:hypothetical protein